VETHIPGARLTQCKADTKGRLKQYWKDIGANEFILGTISEGYVIPFSSNPPSMRFKNNRSAFQNHDFVDTAIAELVDNGCAIKVPFKPYVVSPLSVATQKSGAPISFQYCMCFFKLPLTPLKLPCNLLFSK
jgi:hypothetical protein